MKHAGIGGVVDDEVKSNSKDCNLMDAHAELCDRVELVRDRDGLEAVAGEILTPA